MSGCQTFLHFYIHAVNIMSLSNNLIYDDNNNNYYYFKYIYIKNDK